MTPDFDEYLRIDSPKEPCPECGKPLAFSSQFKKMGRGKLVADNVQKVQVCRHCKKSWHNEVGA